MTAPEAGRLLTPGEAAAMAGVRPGTVSRWVRDGKLHAQRTLGGHRRVWEAEVRALIAADATPEYDLVDTGEL